LRNNIKVDISPQVSPIAKLDFDFEETYDFGDHLAILLELRQEVDLHFTNDGFKSQPTICGDFGEFFALGEISQEGSKMKPSSKKI